MRKILVFSTLFCLIALALIVVTPRLARMSAQDCGGDPGDGYPTCDLREGANSGPCSLIVLDLNGPRREVSK
jgi:hypothetical protein